MVSEARRQSADYSIVDYLYTKTSDSLDRIRHGYAWGFWLRQEVEPVLSGLVDWVSHSARSIREGARSLTQELSESGAEASYERQKNNTIRAVATIAGRMIYGDREAREQFSDVTDPALSSFVSDMTVDLPQKPDKAQAGTQQRLIEQILAAFGPEW
jgi:hypothetical protein